MECRTSTQGRGRTASAIRYALRGVATLLVTALASGCQTVPPGIAPTAMVSAAVAVRQTTMPPVNGRPQVVAAFTDSAGLYAQLVEGYLLIRPRSAADLNNFLARYGGTAVADDGIPNRPEWGLTLTPEQRAPREYVVAIDLARVDVSRFGELAARAGWRGALQFSSDAGLRTFVAALDARARGFRADANFIGEWQQPLPHAPQALPLTLLNSTERAGANFDAFQEPVLGGTTTGATTDVVRAWQFVAAQGIQRTVNVAIIDGGFLLTPTGLSQGGDSDFVAPPTVPFQVDMVQGDNTADGMNLGNCTGGAACPWHGTTSAAVAAGIMNNNAGSAGTGSTVGNLMLFKVSSAIAQMRSAVRLATTLGADVISLSLGYDCDSVACRQRDRKDPAFDDAFGANNRPVFVSAAGNGSGGVGYDVGAPRFYHPCHEDHVICVGALNNSAGNQNTTVIAPYSNFGARVDLFAPSNIPVMTTPTNANGTIPFGGTSASTPYVAGIAAMIKAINPALNSDEVKTILIQTATPGTGNATRVLNALAAVRRAAEPFPMVRDRHEPNGPDKFATDLGTAAAYTENNLNLSTTDRDFFRFNSPGASIANVTLRYASRLGTASIHELIGDGTACAGPTLLSSTPLAAGNGSVAQYRLPGGPHLITTKADTVLAYNMGITFAVAAIAPDGYEVNDTPPAARYLYGFKFTQAGGIGGLGGVSLTSEVTISANIHHGADVDWYLVRGVDTKGKEIGLDGMHILFNTPAVSVFANEARVDLQVYEQRPDGLPGTLVGHLVANSCTPESLIVKLTPNRYYLVRVSGSTGAYTLKNGLHTSSRRHPWKQRDAIYEALHPGEPIEQIFDYTHVYAVALDPAYDGIEAGPGVHLALYDDNAKLVRDGAMQAGGGERLDIRGLARKGFVLEVTRRPDAPATLPPTTIRWAPATPARASANLIQNGGAETAGDDGGTGLASWRAVGGAHIAASSVAYTEVQDLGPSVANEAQRGERLFAGSREGSASALTQTIPLDAGWRKSIDGGSVKATFAGLLGGRGRDGQGAGAVVTFQNARREPIGTLALPTVSAPERRLEPALLRVSADGMVPKGTAFAVVELQFDAGGERTGGGYADQLELKLAEYEVQRQR